MTVLGAVVVASAMLAAPALAAGQATPTVVSLTFDNAWANQMTAAADMYAAGLPGTFYVPSEYIGGSGTMTMANLDTLVSYGDEIGGKTVNNVDLTTVPTNEAEREICEARNILIQDGFDITDFAYPFSDFYPIDETLVADCGFNSARAVGSIADAQPGGCSPEDCPYAETIPPADPFAIKTPNDVEVTSTPAELEEDVTNAEDNGGGWLAFSWHQICDTTTAGCDPKDSMSPELFEQFVTWLAAQEASGAIEVETVQQVIGGTEQPMVTNYPTVPPAPPGVNALVNPTLTDSVSISAPNPAPAGEVTYTVSVTGSGVAPTGSVTVSDGGQSCAINSLSSSGAGSCSIDEAASSTPYTISAVYSGDSNYPAETGTTTETVGGGTATVTPALPDCWAEDSFGTNTPTWTWSTTGGVGGGGEETINMADLSSGNAELRTTFDLGQCSPTTVIGNAYRLSVYYESTVPVFFTLYGRSSTDIWSYWTQSPNFPAATTWTLATWLSPPVPSTVQAMSFGLTIPSNGTLSTSDYSLANTGGQFPEPPTAGVNALQNPLLESAVSGVPTCWTQDHYGTNVQSFSWSQTGGENGGGVETINLTTAGTGTADLITTLDAGNCAPTSVPGDAYAVSVYYESTVPVFFTLYDRNTSGTWAYWTQSTLHDNPEFPASSVWKLATWTTPALPSGMNGVSFGMTIQTVGTLSTSDYSLVYPGVGPAGVTVSGSPNPGTTGPVTYSVTVAGVSGDATPTGSVSVSDGAGGSCTGNLNSSGAASCQITEGAADSPYSVTATYSGDANYAPSSATTTETVGTTVPTLTLTGTSGATTGPVTYDVSVTGTGPTPTGSASVSDGDGGSCSIGTLVNGAGSCQITEAAAESPYSVTATYPGDGNYASSSGMTTENVGTSTPTVTVTGTSGATTGSVTYDVTVAGTGPTPTGSVSVSDGAGGSCLVDLSSGSGACEITEGAADSPYSVTATYSGDANYAPSSGTTTESVGTATATVTVTGAVGATTGPVTYDVNVTGSGLTPTGSVSVLDGAGGNCTASLISGTGSCQITEGALDSSYSVTATYSGDGNYASSFGTTTEDVAPATPTVTVSGPSDATTGLVTYSVSVTGSDITPTGSVSVLDGASGSCSIATLVGGAGTCQITENAGSGPFDVTATYSGDGNYVSTSGATTETVGKATPTVTVTGPNGATTGPVTYNVSVTGSGATPTGMVSVSDGAGGSCSIAALVGGAGSCQITENAVSGPFDVTATYSGDGNYVSTSGATTETVGKATPTVTVTGTLQATTGPVTYNVSVTGSGATPTGMVSVSDGAGGSCTAKLSTGSGTCGITEAAANSPYSVTATYPGDDNYSSSSGVTTETISTATPTVTVTGSSNATTGPVTYSVSVTGAGPTPTGSVSVSDGAGGSCAANLSSGSGSCGITEAAVNSPYEVTASYPGDGNYSSSSDTVTENVSPATPTITVTGTAGATTGPVTYDVTVTGSGITPSGSVSVSDGAGGSCSIGSLSSGAGSCVITESAANSPLTVTASYSGDANYNPASGTTQEVVKSQAATVTVTGTSGATTGPVTYSVSVTGSGPTPTGSVSVSDGAGGSCSITPLVAGAGTCQIAEGAADSPYSVTAFYSGDGNYALASGTTTETVGKAGPALIVTGTAGATTGPVTYNVSVTGSAIAPTGSVSVSDGAGGTCTANLSSGTASCQITEGAVNSPYSVTASYPGDGNYNTGTATMTETVGLATPTVTVTGTTGATTGPVTYNVGVTGYGITPTGSVSVSDGAGGSCTANLGSGTASCQITESAATSPYSVTASYSGDSNYAPASGTTKETVAKGSATVTVTGATGASTGPVTYSVSVKGVGPTPTGSVSVSDGAGGGCSISALVSGAGTCTITENAANSPFTVTASYSGDGNYSASSGTTSQVVAKATPNETVTGSPDPASAAGSVSYSVSVGGAGATPTGSVTVSDGTRSCAISALNSSGVGSCSITEPVGIYTVTSTYAGNVNYKTVAATTTELVGNAATPTVTVTGSPNPASTPGSVNYAVTVTGVSGFTPTGSVTVSDGTRTCSISSLSSSGAGSCTISEPAGTYTVTANYAGNTNYKKASGTVSETVNKATPTVKVTGSPNPASAPGSVTYSVTVTGVSGFTPTGSVTVSDGTRSCTISSLSSSGAGSCSISEPAGTYTVTANYAGNTNYKTASGTVSETVK